MSSASAGSAIAGSRPRIATDVAALLAVAAIFLALSWDYLSAVWSAPLPGGWDAMAHYAVAKLYAAHHFPSLSGWLPDYYAGMPFPDFYPPALYVLVAAVIRLGVPAPQAFALVCIGFTVLVPVLTAACARRICGSAAAAFVAGLLAALYVTDSHYQGAFGISLNGTFEVGLASHPLGHCALLLVLFFLADIRPWWAAAGAALSLAAVPLSNAHVTWNVTVIAVIWAAIATARAPRSERAQLALRIGLIAVCAILLASIWLVPLLPKLPYFATMAHARQSGDAYDITFLFPLLVHVPALALALRRRSPLMVAVTGSSLLFLLIYMAPELPGVSNLPVQSWRIMAEFYYLSPIAAAYLIPVAGAKTPWPLPRRVMVAGACTWLVWFWDPMDSYGAGIGNDRLATYERALEHLDGTGRTLVEVGTGGGDVYGLQVLAGLRGHRSLTTVFREASLGAYFTTPLRNRFSEAPHAFGLDRKIEPGTLLSDRAIARDVDRLRLYGVRHLVVTTPRAKAIAASLPAVERISPPGLWEVYRLPGDPALVTIPSHRPALVFAPASTKMRPDGQLEFLRLAEEAFVDGDFSVPLVRSQRAEIDLEPNLDRFGAVVVVSWAYRDRGQALETLRQVATTRPVILVPSGDSLFEEAAEMAASNDNVMVAPDPRSGAAASARAIVRSIRARAIRLETSSSIASVSDGRHRVTIELAGAPPEPVPLLIHQTYFPAWESRDGAPVYLASPAFQLVFADSPRTELEFRRGPAGTLGAAMGLLALAALGFLAGCRRARTWWRSAWSG